MTSGVPDRHEQFLRSFTTHESSIRAFVRSLVPLRADADDVMQDVAVVLWEKYHEFDEVGNFKAWAYSIARFKVLAWLRDKGRSRLVLDSDVVQQIADQSWQDESRLRVHRDALESCLEKVSTTEREMLSRAYQPNVKIHDVAVASGRSVGGFYQWLYRMRQILLDCVNREVILEIER